ncbi:MAG: hypothetical protein ACT4P4_25730 [Betaproteobacteria bacterium]
MRDLFGEIPVTLAELLAWMLRVPGIAPDSPRFSRYVRAYDVIGKIQRAKAAGELEELLQAHATPAPARLAAAIDAAAAAQRSQFSICRPSTRLKSASSVTSTAPRRRACPASSVS